MTPNQRAQQAKSKAKMNPKSGSVLGKSVVTSFQSSVKKAWGR